MAPSTLAPDTCQCNMLSFQVFQNEGGCCNNGKQMKTYYCISSCSLLTSNFEKHLHDDLRYGLLIRFFNHLASPLQDSKAFPEFNGKASLVWILCFLLHVFLFLILVCLLLLSRWNILWNSFNWKFLLGLQ